MFSSNKIQQDLFMFCDAVVGLDNWGNQESSLAMLHRCAHKLRHTIAIMSSPVDLSDGLGGYIAFKNVCLVFKWVASLFLCRGRRRIGKYFREVKLTLNILLFFLFHLPEMFFKRHHYSYNGTWNVFIALSAGRHKGSQSHEGRGILVLPASQILGEVHAKASNLIYFIWF